MSKYSLIKKDFNVFTINGLEKRMNALIENTRPKLENLGSYFEQYLTTLTGEKYYSHVAQHARRTVNPPDDSWVAFSTNKRGYKMQPHFQIGLFHDHAFCQYGVIYEASGKKQASELWSEQIDEILSLPTNYFISKNHMQPEKMMVQDINEDDVEQAIHRLRSVKSGELLIGKKYAINDEALNSDEAFIADLKNTFNTLYQFYLE